jgi:hypothetical protein
MEACPPPDRRRGAISRGPRDLITFIGGVFHYKFLIAREKRQSHGKFLTPSGDEPPANPASP